MEGDVKGRKDWEEKAVADKNYSEKRKVEIKEDTGRNLDPLGSTSSFLGFF